MSRDNNEYSWAVAFTPLWAALGVLGFTGLGVCCLVPVLVGVVIFTYPI